MSVSKGLLDTNVLLVSLLSTSVTELISADVLFDKIDLFKRLFSINDSSADSFISTSSNKASLSPFPLSRFYVIGSKVVARRRRESENKLSEDNEEGEKMFFIGNV